MSTAIILILFLAYVIGSAVYVYRQGKGRR